MSARKLNHQEIAEFRGRLQAREAQLIAELQAGEQRVNDEPYERIAGEVPDAGDASVADNALDGVNAERERDSDELRQVRAALDRIDAGHYGICRECGGPIEIERLRAIPTAQRDLRHEAERERQRGGIATPRL